MEDQERENISCVTGPSSLTSVDWSNLNHRRSIAASLVKSVYVLELDRQKKRIGPQALAPSWWEIYSFKLKEKLVDEKDKSYFGAIYEFNCQSPNHSSSDQRPPQYVIAFRGTIVRPRTIIEDLKSNIRYSLHTLRKTNRFQSAFELTREIVSKAGHENIWLAGHSLGSSIALQIGRDMAKKYNNKTLLETYLFNPPFISISLQKFIRNENVKSGFRYAKSFFKAGLTVATGFKNHENDWSVISSWTPYLFINPSDPICKKYIRHFEYMEKMKENGAGKIGKIASQHSSWSIGSRLFGKGLESTTHIPSAYLIINSRDCIPNVLKAHGIDQWCRSDLVLGYKKFENK